MTPQTKALLLVGDLLGYIKEIDFYLAKKLALITVNEILTALSYNSNPLFDYWTEVKKEIENL